MLSISAVLRKAHPLNRKLDLEFKTLCPPVDFTFSIDSSEQEVKNQQNYNYYNALDETSARPGVKTSPSDSSHTCKLATANWEKKRKKKKGGEKKPEQKSKQINRLISVWKGREREQERDF